MYIHAKNRDGNSNFIVEVSKKIRVAGTANDHSYIGRIHMGWSYAYGEWQSATGNKWISDEMVFDNRYFLIAEVAPIGQNGKDSEVIPKGFIYV